MKKVAEKLITAAVLLAIPALAVLYFGAFAGVAPATLAANDDVVAQGSLLTPEAASQTPQGEVVTLDDESLEVLLNNWTFTARTVTRFN